MWCEEINSKYSALHPGTTWYYNVLRHRIDRRFAEATDVYRPLPWPARDDGKLDLTLQLLNAYYDKPSDFGPRRCGWSDVSAAGTHPIKYPLVRAFMLRGLVNPPDGPSASYFRTRKIPAHLAKILGGIAVKIFTDPVKSTTQHEDIIVALAEVTLETDVLDVIVWPWFWVWAQGGPSGDALFRTRVFALKALMAIVGRGRVPVNTQTIHRIEALARSVTDERPPASYQEEKERQLFASDAAALAAGVAARLAAQDLQIPPGFTDPASFTPPGTRPPGTWIAPPWVPLAGAISAGVLVVAGALTLAKKRSSQKR
jgi:hypothetical protein